MPIVVYGSFVLRKKSFDINWPEKITLWSANMIQTLKKAGGIGLAGPQVGLLKNIFVIDTALLESDGTETFEKVYINPEILDYGDDKTYYNEGCLSIPGIFEDVNRSQKVEVRYLDLNFDWHKEMLDGIEARIFQHEFDHLQGVLFIDMLSVIKKKLIKSKLRQISKKKL